MREVEPPAAGQQELAARRRHGVEDLDRDACGSDGFGRHQAGRAGADDGDAVETLVAGRRLAVAGPLDRDGLLVVHFACFDAS